MSELEKEVGNLRNGLKAVETVSIPNLFQSFKSTSTTWGCTTSNLSWNKHVVQKKTNFHNFMLKP